MTPAITGGWTELRLRPDFAAARHLALADLYCLASKVFDETFGKIEAGHTSLNPNWLGLILSGWARTRPYQPVMHKAYLASSGL